MIESLPNRSALLFGRAAHIRQLLDRTINSGLTAVVARPLMGKTWTLTEVARQCQEQGDLIGYHESKGAESSHLLYAVANLYARWLSDSSMREQAMSLWTRHKETLVPRVGQMVGTLFEKFGSSLLPDKVPELIRQAFDGPAEAQKDLQSGGVQLAPLPYDQALSLTKLVADVTGRRIVLILDAWEKSASGRSEHATLEAFLKHLDDWPNAHVVLAIRHPDLAAVKDNEAHQRAKDLCAISAAAHLYELREMNLSDATECSRLADSIRQTVPAAQHLRDDQLMDMIDAYPGVVSFWTDKTNRSSMKTIEDLGKVAQNAQTGRYAELDRLLNSLPNAQRTIAAQLAFLPRLDEVRWEALRDLVLDKQESAAIDALIDAAVLSEERAPTFGHDTRHVAARKWFVANTPQMIRRLGKKIVETMAARITGVNSDSLIYFEALAGCDASTDEVGITPDIGYLIDAARCVFGDVDKTMRPDFDARYRSEVQRNQALAPLLGVALRNRGVRRRVNGDIMGAIADYTAVIELPWLVGEQVAQALINRGFGKAQNKDYSDAIADFTDALKHPGATTEEMARAFFNRGVAKGLIEDNVGAIADYTDVIELRGAPPAQVVNALTNRGAMREQNGDSAGAIADYTKAIELPGAMAKQIAAALLNRGALREQEGDNASAIADYTKVIELPGGPSEAVYAAQQAIDGLAYGT